MASYPLGWMFFYKKEDAQALKGDVGTPKAIYSYAIFFLHQGVPSHHQTIQHHQNPSPLSMTSRPRMCHFEPPRKNVGKREGYSPSPRSPLMPPKETFITHVSKEKGEHHPTYGIHSPNEGSSVIA
jgi:hypothetical protein